MTMDRYARQTILPQVGASGQAALSQAAIAVIGAGGLGCPALQYLVGAGVDAITIIDPDVVNISNLHRQPLYGAASQGQAKVAAAKAALNDLNGDVRIEAICEPLPPANVAAITAGADVIMDCADSFAATYTLSDYCWQQHIPFISASALALSGYAGGFCGGAPSLRAVFPALPSNLANCASAGVLGPVVGVLGALQAQMALEVILQLEPSPLGQVITIDFTRQHFASFRFDGAPEPAQPVFPFIAASAITAADAVIELRAVEEAPQAVTASAMRTSVADLQAQRAVLPAGDRLVFCCRSGLRAWRAASVISGHDTRPIALVALGDTPVGPTTGPSH